MLKYIFCLSNQIVSFLMLKIVFFSFYIVPFKTLVYSKGLIVLTDKLTDQQIDSPSPLNILSGNRMMVIIATAIEGARSQISNLDYILFLNKDAIGIWSLKILVMRIAQDS